MIASGSVGEHLFLKVWRYLLLMKISEHTFSVGKADVNYRQVESYNLRWSNFELEMLQRGLWKRAYT